MPAVSRLSLIVIGTPCRGAFEFTASKRLIGSACFNYRTIGAKLNHCIQLRIYLLDPCDTRADHSHMNFPGIGSPRRFWSPAISPHYSRRVSRRASFIRSLAVGERVSSENASVWSGTDEANLRSSCRCFSYRLHHAQIR